ncbi:MAG: hypothetical protein CMF67_13065 [Magnetovibrio sp.]|nr:hypothetical protein [Magnetovibrio sp.]
MMFPMPMPPMPPEIMDAAAANPEGFADCLATGMEAFQGAMGEGGDMGAAFEAMGDVMGPIMQDMGVSPEAFEAAGDAVGAAIGGGMHMAPADCGGAEMGAICQDAVEMMMPPGTEVPAPVMDAMGDMGQGLADAGCMPHDVAGEMMPPPGDPGFPFPCDAGGECIVPPGDPAACPADVCAPPPMDGACADMGGAMMPPEGGYDHAPMPADAVMPPPMDMGEGYIDPAMDMDGDGAPPPPPGDMAAPPPGDMADGGMGALGDALGGPADAGPAAPMPDAADAAIGAAMDGAMDQGGAPAPADPAGAEADPNEGMPAEDDGPEVDPSAGMG